MPKFENVTAHYAANRERYIIEIDGVTYVIHADTMLNAIAIARQAANQN